MSFNTSELDFYLWLAFRLFFANNFTNFESSLLPKWRTRRSLPKFGKWCWNPLYMEDSIFTKAIVKFKTAPLSTTLHRVSFKTKHYEVREQICPPKKHFRNGIYKHPWIRLCTEFHFKQSTLKSWKKICTKKGIFGTESRKKLSSSESAPLNSPLYWVSF